MLATAAVPTREAIPHFATLTIGMEKVPGCTAMQMGEGGGKPTSLAGRGCLSFRLSIWDERRNRWTIFIQLGYGRFSLNFLGQFHF
jgi:hypothetical protein